MKKINSAIDLKNVIELLEHKQTKDLILLKESFLSTCESLKPPNLIKSSLHELLTSPDLRGDLLSNAISLGVGFLSKKVAIGNAHNPLKQLIGVILQMSITKIVSKNIEEIKPFVIQLIKNKLSIK